MLYHYTKVLICVFAGLTLAMPSGAGPGQRFDVQKNFTKVHSSPSTRSPVVMRLNKGDRVVEWRRKGPWVKISLLGRVGRDGWIKLSRLRPEASEIEIVASRNGHFILPAIVNGKVVNFLVDTGATVVALSLRDAQKLGFRESALDFNQPVNTAGGIVRVAKVVLREIKIEELTIRNVIAGVHRSSLRTSLLGMNFLRRLRSYEVHGDRLILRW